MNENQWFLAECSEKCLYIVTLLSKQDFNHFSKIDILGFATIVFEKVYTSDAVKHVKVYERIKSQT